MRLLSAFLESSLHVKIALLMVLGVYRTVITAEETQLQRLGSLFESMSRYRAIQVRGV